MRVFTDAAELSAFVAQVTEAAIAGAATGALAAAAPIATEARAIVQSERNDTGRLAASIGTIQTDTGALVVAGAREARFVERDTVPHWPPFKDPDRGLLPWAERHADGADAESLAFLAARTIAARGTKGISFMARAYEANRTAAATTIGRSVQEGISHAVG